MSYRNTIEITDLSWNDLSGVKLFEGIRTKGDVAETELAQIQNHEAEFRKTTIRLTPSGISSNSEVIGHTKCVYNSYFDQNNFFFYDISGSFNTSQIPGTGTIIANLGEVYVNDVSNGALMTFTVDTNATNITQISASEKQFTGLNYNIWNDLSENVSSGFINNIIYYEDDDSGGPIVDYKIFLSMASPIKIKSSLPISVGNARIRFVGNIANSGPINWDNDTIQDINGESIDLYPEPAGIWIGIDPEPNFTNNDYLYTFFGDETCYHKNTFLQTSNGIKKIEDIKRGDLVKTKNGFKKVVRLLRSGLSNGKSFIVFKKDSLGKNIPNQDLMITKGHPVYYRGKYLNSMEFLNNKKFKNIYIEKRYDSNGLYHIQFESHELIDTHNMWTTSLPHNCGTFVKKEDYFDKSLFDENAKGKHYPPYCLHPNPPNETLDDDDLEHIYQFNESDDEDSD